MSNLIAIKNSNNEIGLGTTHIGLDTIGSSVLPFIVKENDSILMNFNTSNNSINLGTISSGIWQGTKIEKEYGGLGNIAIGSANQILAVNSTQTNYEWVNQTDISTLTNIATNVSSAVGIGTVSQNLIINTSKLNINIGSTNPQEGQVLKYSNNNLTWADSNLNSIDKLWTLMKTLHPAYVLFLKSIQVLDSNSVSAGTLIPTFNPTTTNYSICVGNNITVAILPSVFSFPSGTPNTTTQINNSAVANEYVLSNTNTTYTILNSYTENSQTYNKTYILNIMRDTSTNNDLQGLIVTEEVPTSANVTLNETIGASTVYTIDVDEDVKNIKMVASVSSTATALGIGLNSDGTSLKAINISTNGNSAIGIGTGYVGIGTTLRHSSSNIVDTNIDSGRISNVYMKITAEDSSCEKIYKFEISNPSRSNAELEQIIVTKIKYDPTQTVSTTISNPTTGNITISDPSEFLNISDEFEKIQFTIQRKHINQSNKILKNDDEKQNLSTSTSTSYITNSFLFTNYTLPQSTNNITDTFTIQNTSVSGIVTNSYNILCTRIRSASKIVDQIIYIGTTNQTLDNLSNTTHDLSDGNISSLNFINIRVLRIRGQQVTFLHNESLGVTNTSNIDFFTNTNNNDITKTISLQNSSSNYKIVLRVTAEDNTHQDYTINIT
tara:strand:+ start:2299 stop:4293 length:1995 start_codon:yes stop_codon:yes gene_type:complete